MNPPCGNAAERFTVRAFSRGPFIQRKDFCRMGTDRGQSKIPFGGTHETIRLPFLRRAPALSQRQKRGGAVLGVSISSAYELMQEPGFPVLKIGSRKVVPKEKFRDWVESFTGGGR